MGPENTSSFGEILRNGIKVTEKDRDGILGLLRRNLGKVTRDELHKLAGEISKQNKYNKRKKENIGGHLIISDIRPGDILKVETPGTQVEVHDTTPVNPIPTKNTEGTINTGIGWLTPEQKKILGENGLIEEKITNTLIPLGFELLNNSKIGVESTVKSALTYRRMWSDKKREFFIIMHHDGEIDYGFARGSDYMGRVLEYDSDTKNRSTTPIINTDRFTIPIAKWFYTKSWRRASLTKEEKEIYDTVKKIYDTVKNIT